MPIKHRRQVVFGKAGKALSNSAFGISCNNLAAIPVCHGNHPVADTRVHRFPGFHAKLSGCQLIKAALLAQ
jgi:uncharacterized protein (DUF1786 family)